MPPFDQSRQYLYDLPGEKRSSSYERWLNLRGDNGGGNNQDDPNVGERDGNGKDDGRNQNSNAKSEPGNGDGSNGDDGDDGDDGNGGNRNGDNNNGGGVNGKKNGGKNKSNFPAAASITALALTTPPLAALTTLPQVIPEIASTALAQFQPAILPAISTDSTPVIVLSPQTTSESLTLPTTTDPIFQPSTTSLPSEPTTTDLPSTTFLPPPKPTTSTTLLPPPEPTTTTIMQPLPVPTTSTTPIFVPTTTSTTPVAAITSAPQQPSPVITSVVTMTMSASAVVTSITATTTEILVLTTSGSQRKGEKNHDHNHSNATTTAPTSLADTSGLPPGMTVPRDPPLSPTAEHVLLAAGIIGAFILSGFLLYLFVRLRKIPVGEKFWTFVDRHPRLERILSVIPAVRKRSQWTRRSSSPGWDKDSSRSYDSHGQNQNSMEAFYATGGGYEEKPKDARLGPSGDDLDANEKASISYGMATNPNAPLHVTNPSSTMSFYNVQQPNNAYIPNTARMTRMSELSSLSSGFGDAQIDVPESGPTNGTLNSNMNGYGSTMNSNAATVNTIQPYRQSFMQRASRAFAEPLTSRFSWTTANQSDTSGGQRDTMYTTTSEDSAPRFRTIHSWVNQQTNRVERGRTEPVPSMPPLPPSQRLLKRGSEEPAFRHHPGEEVNIPESTRIESAILDRKLGAGL